MSKSMYLMSKSYKKTLNAGRRNFLFVDKQPSSILPVQRIMLQENSEEIGKNKKK